MRVARAFFLPIIVVTAAIVLSGCMQTTYPAAVAPRSDLDAMAYGAPYPATAPVVVADRSGGGAISALRSAMASSPRTYVAAAPAPATIAANFLCIFGASEGG